MKIILNGQEHEAHEGSTLLSFLRLCSISPEDKGIAVALESNVIPRSQWENTSLRSGMRIEIVRAVAGG